MARQFRLWEQAQIVNLLPPAADAAGRNSSTFGYVSLLFGHKCFLFCGVNQGNAAPVTFTPLQASSAAGANSKGLSNPAPVAFNPDTSNPLVSGTGSDQFQVSGTGTGAVLPAATSFTTDAGLKNKIVMFEIDPGEVMDVNNLANTFNHIGISTGASNASNITFAFAVIMPLRDQRQNPPTTYV
jgi:hypothetical protein